MSKKFNSKRFTLAVSAGVYLALLGAYAVFGGMEGLASACVAGILTILSTYIYGQSKRPSS